MVNIEVALSQESNESNIEFSRDLHGETGWSSDGRHQWKPAHQRFLKKFKAGAPREQKQTIPQEGYGPREIQNR